MARLPIVGGDDDTWGTLLNEFLQVEHASDGYHRITSSTVDVRAYASFSSAIDALGASPKTLLIPNQQNITANKTVPSNVTLYFLQGGSLTISHGVTVTINGHVDAGLYQIFSWTGTGEVVFGAGAVKEVYPEWWGAKPDASTDIIQHQHDH